MAKKVSPSPEEWKVQSHRGRNFFHFDLEVKDQKLNPFSVATIIADRYQVENVLARGGGGVILEATDRTTGNPVLIKALAEYDLLRYDLQEPIDEMVESVRRSRHHLQTERRILVQLRNAGCKAVPHPNNYVFDFNPALRGPYWTRDNQQWWFDERQILETEPYLVMERVEGMNLKKLVESNFSRGMESEVALHIVDQVARVVELLQQPLAMSNGQTWELVYQDIKPDNILVNRFGHAIVLDFGGCQLVIDGELVLHGSHSAGYCAPECGQSDEPIGRSADCYGLGTTLFHLLMGMSPRRLLPKDRPPGSPRAVQIDARQVAGRCSNGVQELLAKCVSWDRSARFQSVTEFREALAPFLTVA